MNLKLERPLVFFDLETTGVQIATDRIVEISILKVYPNGNKESWTRLVNPEIEIPKEASDIHGITNEKVVTEPKFDELAPKISTMIEGCDLAGFNSNRFDIPLLAEEMLRAKVNFDMKDRRAVDVQVIFHKKEQRNLGAGYEFYCGKTLDNAHSAEADTQATYEILEAQIGRYEDVEGDVDFLSNFSSHQKRADFAGFILMDDNGEEIFSFGKYKGRKVRDVLRENPGYYSWMQNADFPLYTKKILTVVKKSMNPKKTVSTLEDLQNKFNKKI
ncbi:MAG: exonuclease domain-containing protein [Lutimonas sp.]